jgi:hypothetical protein
MDRQFAASHIIAAHTPDQITRIIGWADRDIAERLRIRCARFFTKHDNATI